MFSLDGWCGQKEKERGRIRESGFVFNDSLGKNVEGEMLSMILVLLVGGNSKIFAN